MLLYFAVLLSISLYLFRYQKSFSFSWKIYGPGNQSTYLCSYEDLLWKQLYKRSYCRATLIKISCMVNASVEVLTGFYNNLQLVLLKHTDGTSFLSYPLELPGG